MLHSTQKTQFCNEFGLLLVASLPKLSQIFKKLYMIILILKIKQNVYNQIE